LPGPDDLAALRRSRGLLAAFTGPDGQPGSGYLAAVRRRFGRWILDTAAADYDQAWVKAVLLQVILWSHPYVRDGDF
jgi:hypothetical protein